MDVPVPHGDDESDDGGFPEEDFFPSSQRWSLPEYRSELARLATPSRIPVIQQHIDNAVELAQHELPDIPELSPDTSGELCFLLSLCHRTF